MLPAAGLGEMPISFSELLISVYAAVRRRHVAFGGVFIPVTHSDTADSTECKCASATYLLPLGFSTVHFPDLKGS